MPIGPPFYILGCRNHGLGKIVPVRCLGRGVPWAANRFTCAFQTKNAGGRGLHGWSCRHVVSGRSAVLPGPVSVLALV